MGTLFDDTDRCAQLAEMLKALGHPIRLRIVVLLCDAEAHVGAIAERLGAAQATVSQQLSILRSRRLVEKEIVDGRALYRLAEPRLRELVSCMKGCQVR